MDGAELAVSGEEAARVLALRLEAVPDVGGEVGGFGQSVVEVGDVAGVGFAVPQHLDRLLTDSSGTYGAPS